MIVSVSAEIYFDCLFLFQTLTFDDQGCFGADFSKVSNPHPSPSYPKTKFKLRFVKGGHHTMCGNCDPSHLKESDQRCQFNSVPLSFSK